MGRKRKQSEKQYIWCYYCDREFDDENTLISHQVARHFKCENCGKKLGTFRGLFAHNRTNHHIELQVVPHAIAGRDSVTTDIHGMTGIPEIALYEYRVKKAKELGLPIPTREVAVVRNPHQEFAARLEESQSQSQMAGSLSTLTLPVPSNPFVSTVNPVAPVAPMTAGVSYNGYSYQGGAYGAVAPAAPAPKMIYTRTDVSMEEWRAQMGKYNYQKFVNNAASKLSCTISFVSSNIRFYIILTNEIGHMSILHFT